MIVNSEGVSRCKKSARFYGSTNKQESQCGWLTDKFGLSWQIIPKQGGEYLGEKDAAKAGRAMNAMMKIEVNKLKEAFDGKWVAKELGEVAPP